MASEVRSRLRIRRMVAPIAITLLAACASVAYVPVAPESVAETIVAQGGRTNHVILVSIDGLRPDAIEQFGARTLQRLMTEGAYSLEATTIMPSRTLPSHTSMLTGLEPEDHGVTWNSRKMDDHGHVASPTIFAAARQAGLRTAAFFSKSKFEHLADPLTLDHVQIPGGLLGKSRAESTVDHVERHLRTARPNLMFVHIGEPDFAGHVFGWMSGPYGWAVRTADAQIGELIAAADRAFGAGNYTLLLTADHGGHDRDHGSADPRDVTIPWIAWGKGVASGTTLPPGIRTVDSAATALWLLGLGDGERVAGHAVTGAFAATATVASGGQQ
jgi:predicted AlkP superfamily pyrophosphatase or phosphodiesterase